jgi:hypothetical protein
VPEDMDRFDAFKRIFPSGVDEIVYLSMIPIRLRVIIFEISPPNIQLPKGEVIIATKSGHCILPPQVLLVLMEIKLSSPGNHLQHRVICVEIYIPT